MLLRAGWTGVVVMIAAGLVACAGSGPGPGETTAASKGTSAGPGVADLFPWGAVEQGLRVRFIPGDIRPDGTLNLQLQFEFRPKEAPPELTTLLHHPAAGLVSLTFKDVKSGAVYERPASPPFFPEQIGPADFFDLRGILVPRDFSVRLLSPEGELVPPGAYDVTLAYANEKALELSPHAQNYAGRLWLGRVESGKVRLHVPELSPQTVTVTTYDSLTSSVELPVVKWQWDLKTRRPVVVKSRPGYALGRQEKVFMLFPGGEHELAHDVSGSLDIRPTGNGNVIQSGLKPSGYGAMPISPDTLLGLRVEQVLFETSAPPVYDWKPEMGDYRVLWSQEKAFRFKRSSTP